MFRDAENEKWSGMSVSAAFLGRIAKLLPIVVALLLGGIAPSVILAADEGVLEEIVITARKKSESLQDVPIAVAAFSGEDLSNWGIGGIHTLQNATPGLVFSTTGALTQPYLRGVGTRLAIAGLESSIAIYVDDRYNARTTSAQFDFADVERVEVLKGPQGTLYGRNSTGGAIRVITKGVGEELEGSLKASAGNFGYFGLSGTATVPFSDTFGARFTLYTNQRDGFVDNLVSGDGVPSELDDRDFSAFRAKFRWDISDTLTARFTIDYEDREDSVARDQTDIGPPGTSQGIARGGISGTSADEVATLVPRPVDKHDALSMQLRFEGSYDAFDFASITTYYDLDQEWGVDADGTSCVCIDVPVQFETAEDFSQEFQFSAPADSEVDWIVGAYLYNQEVNYTGVIEVGLPFTLSQGLNVVETDAWALFGQATWDLNDVWSLTVGGRYSYEEKDVATLISPVAFLTIGAPNLPFFDKEDWNEFTPKITLQYSGDNYITYATLARGFKSGGFNSPAVGNTPLDPEILDMFEVGYKGDFRNDTVRLNASLFYYDYTDLQVTKAASGATALLTTENAADAEILGLDLDLTWLVQENLTIMAGLSLLDTEYKDFNTAAKIPNSVLTGDPTASGTSNRFFDASGENLLRAPEMSFFVAAEINVPLTSGEMPVTLSYAYKDDYEFDFVDHPLSKSLIQDGYGVFTARISYVPNEGNWSVALWGNNLFDEEYFDDKVANNSGYRGSYAPPRTYGIDVSFNF